MNHTCCVAGRGVPDAGTPPVDGTGKQLIGVRGVLHWAFGRECAALDYDEVGASSGGKRVGVGMEHRIAEQLALGMAPGVGVCVDTSIGRSLPHHDADIVATTVRNVLPWRQAIWVAELARAGKAPVWDLGPQRIQPREWSKRVDLRQGRREVCRVVEYVVNGRLRKRDEWWTPCVWVPSADRIAAARRAYLEWWGCLLEVFSALKGHEFQRFTLTKAMPPMTPWKKGVAQINLY